MSDNLVGQSIGRYHIIEQLGRGGMAVVYSAFDTRLERKVAIKVIRVDTISQSMLGHMLKRFEREAKALARMSHPNIVKIHDYGDHQGSPYLVMEFLSGGTLKEKTGRSLPYQEAARLLVPVARALDYAHRQDIIHRDVKPANILITEDGEPMLSDFGIAKILESEQTTQLTGTGLGIGTPDYMAPEQWGGKVVPQTDIYALGVVFYELVTGQKPYTADTPAAVAIKQATAPLPRPKDFVPGLPDQVEQVIYKALAKDPSQRYESMGAFAQALSSLADQPAGISQPPSIVKKSGETATLTMPPGVVPATMEVGAPPQEKRGFPRWAYFAAGGILLGGICIAIVAFGYFGLWTNLFGTKQTPLPPATSAAILPERKQTPSPSPTRTSTPTPRQTATKTPTETMTPTPTKPANLYYELTYDPKVWEYQQDGDLDMLVYRDDPTCILEFWWGRGLDFDLKRESTTEFAGITWTITTYLRGGKIILEQYTPMVDGREYFNPYGIRIYGYEPITSQCRDVSREVLSTFQLPK